MKRRKFFHTLAALPAASALHAQQAGASPDDLPKLEPSVPDGAADPVPHFFTAAQFATLRKTSDIIIPPVNGSPGALTAGAAEFLDFLIGDSDAERRHVYRAGLDGLNAQAQKRFNKPFADLDNAQADLLLAPLGQPWTFDEPDDPVARFLRTAKADVRTATMNSREYGAGRRFVGSGLYWYPLD
jgi:hypothetical protein